MSSKIDEIIGSLDLKGLLGKFEEAGKQWLDDNKDLATQIGKDGAKAVLMMGLLESMPDEIEDPDLNIKKMEASAKLLELAAEHQAQIDEAKESAKSFFSGLLKTALGHLASVVTKASVLALV